MLKTLFGTVIILIFFSSKAQSGEAIIAELTGINKTVVSKHCNAASSAAISNRAVNVFLADKTGYLSESSDLSLYTNYVTLNSTDGQLTLNHNFQKAAGNDEPIKKLFSVGISGNVANELTPFFLDKRFENELGLMMGYKWLGKVKTHFTDCVQTGNNRNQKQAMDALRAAILHSLQTEITKREADFKIAINAIDSSDIPMQNIDSAKAVMLRNFYEDLREEYAEKFAKQQAELLTKTKNFKRITTGWTSISAYIPVIAPAYTVATSVTTPFQKKHAYPLHVVLSQTRLWESITTGKWFVTLSAKALYDNSKSSYLLNRVDFDEYKVLGGTDTFSLTDVKNGKAYIGRYETFVTTSLKCRLVYFPPADTHVGISFSLEQNFGRYKVLNGKLGIPVILINSKKLPALNLEFYVLFFDMHHKTEIAEKYGDRTSVGLHVGIPFSRLMY